LWSLEFIINQSSCVLVGLFLSFWLIYHLGCYQLDQNWFFFISYQSKQSLLLISCHLCHYLIFNFLLEFLIFSRILVLKMWLQTSNSKRNKLKYNFSGPRLGLLNQKLSWYWSIKSSRTIAIKLPATEPDRRPIMSGSLELNL
jgi:hypothetical protein